MRFIRIWRSKFLTTNAKTLEDMANLLENAVKELDDMQETGEIKLEGEPGDDYFLLTTTNPDVARDFGFTEDEDQEDV